MTGIRVGVVGMGLMGSLHARIYSAMSGVTLAGVVDADAERLSPWRERGVPVFPTVEALLDAGVQALSICTPESVRGEVMTQPLERRVALLVEKPLAHGVEEAEALRQLARRRAVHLGVGYPLRFDARVWAGRRAIAQGSIGRPVYLKIWRCGGSQSGRQLRQRTSVVSFLSVHDVNLIPFLTGAQVTEVVAAGDRVLGPQGGLDSCAALLGLSDGSHALLESSWLLPPTRHAQLDAGVKVQGDRGVVEIDLTHEDLMVSGPDGERSIDAHHWPEIDGELRGDLRRELEAFVATLSRPVGPQDEADLDQAVQDVRVCEALVRSVRSGARVRVPA